MLWLYILVRNKDLTWPEEMSQLAKNKATLSKQGKWHRIIKS